MKNKTTAGYRNEGQDYPWGGMPAVRQRGLWGCLQGFVCWLHSVFTLWKLSYLHTYYLHIFLCVCYSLVGYLLTELFQKKEQLPITFASEIGKDEKDSIQCRWGWNGYSSTFSSSFLTHLSHYNCVIHVLQSEVHFGLPLHILVVFF